MDSIGKQRYEQGHNSLDWLSNSRSSSRRVDIPTQIPFLHSHNELASDKTIPYTGEDEKNSPSLTPHISGQELPIRYLARPNGSNVDVNAKILTYIRYKTWPSRWSKVSADVYKHSVRKADNNTRTQDPDPTKPGRNSWPFMHLLSWPSPTKGRRRKWLPPLIREGASNGPPINKLMGGKRIRHTNVWFSSHIHNQTFSRRLIILNSTRKPFIFRVLSHSVFLVGQMCGQSEKTSGWNKNWRFIGSLFGSKLMGSPINLEPKMGSYKKMGKLKPIEKSVFVSKDSRSAVEKLVPGKDKQDQPTQPNHARPHRTSIEFLPIKISTLKCQTANSFGAWMERCRTRFGDSLEPSLNWYLKIDGKRGLVPHSIFRQYPKTARFKNGVPIGFYVHTYTPKNKNSNSYHRLPLWLSYKNNRVGGFDYSDSFYNKWFFSFRGYSEMKNLVPTSSRKIKKPKQISFSNYSVQTSNQWKTVPIKPSDTTTEDTNNAPKISETDIIKRTALLKFLQILDGFHTPISFSDSGFTMLKLLKRSEMVKLRRLLTQFSTSSKLRSWQKVLGFYSPNQVLVYPKQVFGMQKNKPYRLNGKTLSVYRGNSAYWHLKKKSGKKSGSFPASPTTNGSRIVSKNFDTIRGWYADKTRIPSSFGYPDTDIDSETSGLKPIPSTLNSLCVWPSYIEDILGPSHTDDGGSYVLPEYFQLLGHGPKFKKQGITVIASTKDLTTLDAALLRPGRFDTVIDFSKEISSSVMSQSVLKQEWDRARFLSEPLPVSSRTRPTASWKGRHEISKTIWNKGSLSYGNGTFPRETGPFFLRSAFQIEHVRPERRSRLNGCIEMRSAESSKKNWNIREKYKFSAFRIPIESGFACPFTPSEAMGRNPTQLEYGRIFGWGSPPEKVRAVAELYPDTGYSNRTQPPCVSTEDSVLLPTTRTAFFRTGLAPLSDLRGHSSTITIKQFIDISIFAQYKSWWLSIPSSKPSKIISLLRTPSSQKPIFLPLLTKPNSTPINNMSEKYGVQQPSENQNNLFVPGFVSIFLTGNFYCYTIMGVPYSSNQNVISDFDNHQSETLISSHRRETGEKTNYDKHTNQDTDKIKKTNTKSRVWPKDKGWSKKFSSESTSMWVSELYPFFPKDKTRVFLDIYRNSLSNIEKHDQIFFKADRNLLFGTSSFTFESLEEQAPWPKYVYALRPPQGRGGKTAYGSATAANLFFENFSKKKNANVPTPPSLSSQHMVTGPSGLIAMVRRGVLYNYLQNILLNSSSAKLVNQLVNYRDKPDGLMRMYLTLSEYLREGRHMGLTDRYDPSRMLSKQNLDNILLLRQAHSARLLYSGMEKTKRNWPPINELIGGPKQGNTMLTKYHKIYKSKKIKRNWPPINELNPAYGYCPLRTRSQGAKYGILDRRRGVRILNWPRIPTQLRIWCPRPKARLIKGESVAQDFFSFPYSNGSIGIQTRFRSLFRKATGNAPSSEQKAYLYALQGGEDVSLGRRGGKTTISGFATAAELENQNSHSLIKRNSKPVSFKSETYSIWAPILMGADPLAKTPLNKSGYASSFFLLLFYVCDLLLCNLKLSL